MVKRFILREKYIAPKLEAEQTVPDILCDSAGGDIELVDEGDPWEI